MEVKALNAFLLLFCSDVVSDWVELPQVLLRRSSNSENVSSFEKLLTLSTSLKPVFKETLEVSSVSSLLTSTPVRSVMSIQNMPDSKETTVKMPDSKESQIEDNFTLTESVNKEELHTLNEPYFENIEARDESEVVKETLKEASFDLLDKPNSSLPRKLKYLHKMEVEMSAQIRKLSQGLWRDRQARGKKLMSFASMEGALMTIAFLTFAVFLVKVVHQFIQGLQSSELAMVELPTTPTLRFSRPQRQQRDLAAAQLLQYMDEFKIKHRTDCDYF